MEINKNLNKFLKNGWVIKEKHICSSCGKNSVLTKENPDNSVEDICLDCNYYSARNLSLRK